MRIENLGTTIASEFCNHWHIDNAQYTMNLKEMWLPPYRKGIRGVTTLKKVVRNAGQGRFAGGGRHCLKGRPCRNARYWRCNTALGLRDAEDRLSIGRHVKYDSIDNESLYRFHLNAGRFFRVQFIWYCGHWGTNENPNLYYNLVTPFRPSVRALPCSPNDSGL